MRVAHLSDFHLGVPSRGAVAVDRAIDWVESASARSRLHHRRPPLRPRGEQHLLELLARLEHPYVVLGNHDLAVSRDPFSRPAALTRLEHGTLLRDSSVVVELRGRRVEIAGVDPRSWIDKRRSGFDDPEADLGSSSATSRRPCAGSRTAGGT